MSELRRLLQFVFPFKWQAALAVLLGFLAIGANVGLMGTSGYLIASAALRPESILLLWVPIVAVRFFGLSRGVLRYVERLVSHDLTFRVLARMRVWLYERIEPRAPILLEQRRSGDVLSSIISDVEQMQNLYLRVLAPPVIAALTAVLGFSILANYNVTLGFTLIVMMIVGGIGLPLMSLRIGRTWGEETVNTRSQIYTETTDMVAGLPELLAFGRTDDAVSRIDDAQERLNGLQTKMNRLSAISSGLMVGVSNLAMWVVLLLAIPFVTSGRISGIAIPTVVLVTLACFEAVIPLPLAFQQWGQTMAAGRRLFQLADGEGESSPAKGEPSYNSLKDTEHPMEITVRNLVFSYGDKESDVLRGISFLLTPGKHMAVIGESGAGKSSILQVLLKLRPYRAGSVQIGGKELQDLPDDWVRNQLAVVSQDAYLFNATVADNLRLAKPDAPLKELEQAARSAYIHETIVQLPQGYDTLIGEWGTRLSGGERQRLALARALLRNAPILLFDEPTTGLDPLTEKAFLTTMQTVLKGKSVLWITHRLSRLNRMDEILVLRNGLLQEQGTHDCLLEHKGYYSLLWDLQSEQMRDL